MIRNTKPFVLAWIFFCTGTLAPAAKAQISVGLNAGINNTFFHKAGSEYDPGVFTPMMDQGLGLSVPVVFDLHPNWSLRSGAGFVVKQFSFNQDSFPLTSVKGSMQSRNRINALEIPLIIGFKRTLGEKKFLFEYQAGVVAAFNSDTRQKTEFFPAENAGDSAASVSGVAFYKRRPFRFSPDLYVAVTLIRFSESMRRHQFTLSYQYGLNNVSDVFYSNYAESEGQSTVYSATLRPRLSYLSLSYTFFPRWLQWGSPAGTAD
jgi:hypothetical protein